MFITRKEFENYKHELIEAVELQINELKKENKELKKELDRQKKNWLSMLQDIIKLEAKIDEEKPKQKTNNSKTEEEKIFEDMATIAGFSINNVLNEIKGLNQLKQ